MQENPIYNLFSKAKLFNNRRIYEKRITKIFNNINYLNKSVDLQQFTPDKFCLKNSNVNYRKTLENWTKKFCSNTMFDNLFNGIPSNKLSRCKFPTINSLTINSLQPSINCTQIKTIIDQKMNFNSFNMNLNVNLNLKEQNPESIQELHEEKPGNNKSSLNLSNDLQNSPLKITDIKPDQDIENSKEFQKNVLISIIKEGKIPKQILNDPSFGIFKSEYSCDPSKFADLLLSYFDIIIKPVRGLHFHVRPYSTDNGDIFCNSNIRSKQSTLMNSSRIYECSVVHKVSRKTENKTSFKLDSIKFQKKFFGKTNLHPINKIIILINKFSNLTFRNKSNNFDLPTINQIYKMLGLNIFLNKASFSLDKIKSKEYLTDLKECLKKILYRTINRENGITVASRPNSNFKYCVFNGNNSHLIISMLKQRWWWGNPTDYNDPNCNLLWSQWKNDEFIYKLRKNEIKIPQLKDEIKKEVYSQDLKMCNHLEFNYVLGNKKCLFYSIKSYFEMNKKDPFSILPQTFHIKSVYDPEYEKFIKEYRKNETLIAKFRALNSDGSSDEDDNSKSKKKENIKKEQCTKNIWIVKPGENTNRGNGITVTDSLREIDKIIKRKNGGHSNTYLIQKYIENPLLIYNRKFDIRCFGLITSINGFNKGII